jgi:hypothetical protein
MSESFLQLKTDEYDGINFYLNEDDDIEVDSFKYTEEYEKLPGSAMGDLYDIIIFPEDPPKMPERFKAILTSPIHYVERMVEDGFLGVVAKATTTSDEFMDEVEEHMNASVATLIRIYEREHDE